jgi:2-oxo-4-hydroxy-4-carboxy-5-ureidoimidazoline decarboxylase
VTAPGSDDALARFNDAPQSEAAERPYASVGALVTRAAQLTRALPWQHVSALLEAHPGTADSTDDEGTRAYTERFGHPFLVRTAGRSPEEVRRELERRLGNDPAAEQAEVTAQLVEVTALRVREAMR